METITFVITKDDETVIMTYLSQLLRDNGMISEEEYKILITKG